MGDAGWDGVRSTTGERSEEPAGAKPPRGGDGLQAVAGCPQPFRYREEFIGIYRLGGSD